ncbi:MAG: Fe-S cluster assembly protein SufB [Acidobacteriota bacterium]|jgi:Fe-S cluster assembly protein SufB
MAPETEINNPALEINDEYKYGFSDPEKAVFKAKRGLNHEVVEQISQMKKEPEWMRQFRHHALDIFYSKPMPNWGNVELLGEIDFDNIFYYLKPADHQGRTWDDVPEDIKNTFDRLGIPEAERKFLAGVSAQYESEVVYHSMKEELEKQGVIFLDMDSGLREYEDVVKQYFATVIPPTDNKFAALNSAVWSGGSFVYVPKGVEVDIPLQAYFRINAQNMGQFERTLIIADEGSRVHYIEGCTAPTYASDSLHSAVVELVALPGSHLRYTTIQNWSKNVYNLVTKRAVAHENSTVEWVDGNLGSKLTMKFPCVYLVGEKAHGEILSIAFANTDQHQDAGAKIYHAAPNTTSRITSKSISKGGGRASYRGMVKVYPGAVGSKVQVECDALLMDENSRSDTYPTMEIAEEQVQVEHEARVSKVGDEQLFYLMSRGLTEEEALVMVVNGFIEPFVKELPMEYAVELNRLIQLEMEGSVG